MDATTYRRISARDSGGCLQSVAAEPCETTPYWAQDVAPAGIAAGPATTGPAQPCFMQPIPFVIPPLRDSGEPFFPHNHQPAITWCANGDLLAAWFSTEQEAGLEMTVLAGRLRAGRDAWDPSAEFFKAPRRNMTGTALFHDGHGTLYHFNGMGAENVTGWSNLVVLLRTSRDNGVTWSAPRAISEGARYQMRNQVIAGTSITPAGLWLQPCDGTPRGQGPTALHVSRDGGDNWADAGGDIRGIHAGVTGLDDGRLLAFGRAQSMEGCMPASISEDQGRSWTYRPSPFPSIGTGQRLVLLRLREGPLMLASFTDATSKAPRPELRGLAFKDDAGKVFTGYGLFAAVSYDEGATWPARKLLTPGSGTYDGGGWTGSFTFDAAQAEPRGYLAATQTPDGVIHLISSRLHYRFNHAWLET